VNKATVLTVFTKDKALFWVNKNLFRYVNGHSLLFIEMLEIALWCVNL